MAIQTATNPETGERVALVNGRWVPFTQSATNDQGQKAFLVGGQWVTDGPVAAPKPAEEEGVLRQAADVPVSIARGAAMGVRMVADAFGANNPVSNSIKGVEDYLGGLLSAQAKQDEQEVARIMKDAEDKGVLEQVKAGFRAFATAPVDLLAQGLGTAAPAIVGGLGATLLRAGAVGATAAGAGIGAGMGAGAVKGQIYEGVKEALAQTGMSPEQVEARAQLAQAYGGENLDMILAGAALGGLASATGIEPILARQAAKSIVGRSIAGRAATTGVAEAVPEIAQGSQEQLAQNIALQREGFDVDTMRGVVGAGTLEGLAGAGLGATVGAASQLADRRPRGEEPPAPDAAIETPPDVEPVEADADVEPVDAELETPAPQADLEVPPTARFSDEDLVATGVEIPPASLPLIRRLTVGKTREELQGFVAENPEYFENDSTAARVIRSLVAEPVGQPEQVVVEPPAPVASPVAGPATIPAQAPTPAVTETPSGTTTPEAVEAETQRPEAADPTVPVIEDIETPIAPSDSWNTMDQQVRTKVAQAAGLKKPENFASKKWGSLPKDARTKLSEAIATQEASAAPPAGEGRVPSIEEVETTRQIEDLEKQRRKIERTGASLLGTLRRIGMVEEDLKEVYGRKIPLSAQNLRYKDRPGTSISTLVANGTLDAWLPYDKRLGAANFDGQEAEQIIKDRLGEKRFLTEDTEMEMRRLSLYIDDLEQALKLEDINEELEIAAQEQRDLDQEAEADAARPEDRATGRAEEAQTGPDLELTSPSPETFQAAEKRAAQAPKDLEADQIRRESEAGAGQFRLEGGEGRQDLTGKLFQQDGKPAKESAKIKRLRDKLENAPLISQEQVDAIFELKDAVQEDAEQALERGEAAVYVGMNDDGATTLVLTPSAQKPGQFQLTRYVRTGAFGDSQYTSIGKAIDENGLIYMTRLPLAEAERRMNQLMEAEGEYQSSKTKSLFQQDSGVAGDEIIVDGAVYPVKGSTGRVIESDPQKLRNFWRWAGAKKLVGLGDDHEFRSGEPIVVESIHATTGDFDTFDRRKGNIESDLGAGFYSTNNVDDAAENYAGFGPDLTAKLTRRSEALFDEMDEAERNELVEKATGKKWSDLSYEEKRGPLLELAKKEFASVNEGLTMPVYVRFTNPVVIGGKGETYLDYDQSYDEDTEEDGEESGKLVDLIMAIRELGDSGSFEMDTEKAVDALLQEGMDSGGMKASDAIDALKKALVYAVDYDSGDLASTEIIRQAFELAGFDGFIDTTVNKKFGSEKRVGKPMKGMNPDTVHFIAFNPVQMKSAIGNEGSYSDQSPNILESKESGKGWDIDPAEQAMERELVGKSVDEIGQWVVDNAPNQFTKVIAQKVQARIREMQRRGVNMKIEVLTGDRRPMSMYSSRGSLSYTFSKGKPADMVLKLNGAAVVNNQAGYPPGMRYTTVLHEMLHMATTAQTAGLKNDHPLMRELNSIRNKVVDEFNKRVKAGNLSDFESRIYNRSINALANTDEILAWGLTDTDMQKFMASIKVGEKTLFDKFVELMRKVLGLDVDYESAMDRLVKTSDQLLDMSIDEVAQGIEQRGYMFGPAQPRLQPGDTMQGELFSAQQPMSKPPVGKQRLNIFNQTPLSQWTKPDETKMADFVYTMQDKLVDTKDVVKAIQDQVGKIEEQWNPYLQEELYHGRTAKQTKDFLSNEMRPLVKMMERMGVTIDELDTYLHNRIAERRNKQAAALNPNLQDGGSGIMTADARAYLAGLTKEQKAKYEQLAKKVDQISQGTRNLLVDTGLESQETVDAWEAENPNYVPLFREDVDYGVTKEVTTGLGFNTKGGTSKRFMGSQRKVVNILANIAMQRERAIVRSNKNRVAVATYGLAVKNPNPGFWLAVNPDAKNIDKVIDELMKMGLSEEDAKGVMQEPVQARIERKQNPKTGLMEEQIVYEVNPAARGKFDVFASRVNGQDRYVFFNGNDPRAARMVTALKNLDADSLGRAMGMAATITRYFAAINTQYNPIFGAFNFLRDMQGAAIQVSNTPLAGKRADIMAGAFPALKGIYTSLRADTKGKTAPMGQWAKLWDEFQQEGGQTGFRDQFSRSDERAEALEKELKQISEGKAKKAGRAIFNWLSDYNDAMENALRLSAYKAGLDKGLSKQEAASVAKNLTVNFNRKGQVGVQANALYAFFNAAVQGTARLLQTLGTVENGKFRLTKVGKTILGGGFLLGSLQALALAAAGFDDDEPPQFIRERNFIIPTGDGKYLTFPMPLGYNVIPNTSRIITEFVLSGGKDPAKRVADITSAFLDMFNPIGNAGWSAQTIAPTIADPLVALTENKDWTGKPIAREDFSNLDPTPGYTRAKETASWFSKNLSEFMNLASGGTSYKPGVFSPTPDQIDYLIGVATGGVGRELLKLEQTVTGAVTGEEVPTYKIPLAGRFFGDTKAAASEANKFYTNLKELNQHKNEIEGRRKNKEDVAGYIKENPEARLANAAGKIERNVQALRKKRRELVENDAPKEKVQQVEKQITAQMKRLNEMVSKLEK